MEERRFNEELTIVPLLAKRARGEDLTDLEQQAIKIWLAKSKSNQELFDELQDPQQVGENLADFATADSTTESSLEKLHILLDQRERRSAQKRKGWFTAIAVVLAVAVSSMFYINYQSDGKPDRTGSPTIATDILPGTDQAILIFDKGETIQLNSQAIEIDNKGTYFADGKAIASDSMQYATLSTPRKGKSKITLPDGTKVWLNAESYLKFPSRFPLKDRMVELNGEGYFEVAHDSKKPFIVISNGQQVKVLGTKFNINAYENEVSIQTTLVSGKVELTNSQNTTPVILKPGQQGELFSLSSVFLVNNVDTEAFTAWTRNDFQFNGIPLKEVFRQLERWYDIDVDYSQVPTITVHATISREKKLSSVLYTLEQITNLKFDVQKGRRLTIIR
ncbi:hypothetical protein BBI01_01255 [Chryseobacterium artocarpi]|uniref:Iron dicitrate transport regulator FecR n=1 Tax=Chryseobacterium artocarpi TaxID=1414727 RepID=A0A1B8ZZT9_9FLAO|nr:FecR family protein [Chryseobacterium artocarpi]OCA77119.1 hypothetical protein BBI01_01255 [Chryseobacterium artocarpi]